MQDIFTIISICVVFFIVIIYISRWIFLILVNFYEKEINKLYDDLENKILELKSQPGMLQDHFEGSVKRLKKDCKPKIEKLERKRRFILEKLPFIKK